MKAMHWLTGRGGGAYCIFFDHEKSLDDILIVLFNIYLKTMIGDFKLNKKYSRDDVSVSAPPTGSESVLSRTLACFHGNLRCFPGGARLQ